MTKLISDIVCKPRDRNTLLHRHMTQHILAWNLRHHLILIIVQFREHVSRIRTRLANMNVYICSSDRVCAELMAKACASRRYSFCSAAFKKSVRCNKCSQRFSASQGFRIGRFLCADFGLNETMVRIISPSMTDEMTFREQGDAYRSLTSQWRWRRVTGIRFDRVSLPSPPRFPGYKS
jgi:hypothetical protein